MSTVHEHELDHRWDAYIDWLIVPPAMRGELGLPTGKEKYADAIGVAITTLRRWEAKPLFLRAWKARSAALVGSPERVQAVVDAMWAAAAAGDVKAAQVYLGYVQKAEPPKSTEGAAESMTLEEIEDAIQKAKHPHLRAVPNAA